MSTARSKGKRIDTGKPSGRRRSAARQRRKKRAALIATISFVGVLAATFLALRTWVRPPAGGVGEVDLDNNPHNIVSRTDGRDGIYTILIAAENDGSNTDTIMVACIDTKKETVNIMGIPRDTRVETATRTNKKINAAFSAGYNSPADSKEERYKNGYNALRKEVAALIGYEPKHYVGLGLQGFAKLVDMIGGVEFDVPIRMQQGRGMTLGTRIDLQPGLQTLDGNKALMLVRFRGYGSSFSGYGTEGRSSDDWGRIKTQQEFLKAVLKKCKDSFTLSDTLGYIDIASESVTSSMSTGEMVGLLEKVYEWIGDEGSVGFHTLPTEPSGILSYLRVIEQEAHELINEKMNPFDEPINFNGEIAGE
ncbi:MAG: LCP family protein [Oscillospiraceae bacterium]|nr:LCP family protein [Oscillospiraceae bacterium]